MNNLAILSTELLAGDAAGKWVQLVPAGTFMARDGRGPWVAGDRVALAAIVERTRQYHGRTEMVIDYDHQSVFGAKNGVGGTAKAAGWVKQLEARDDGIYGLVEWTPAAAAAIRAGEYRYISPVIPTVKEDGRVILIINAALTNTPALDLATVAASAASFRMPKEMKMDTIIAALGLPAEADEAAVLSAIAGLKANRPDPSKFVSIDLYAAAVADGNKLRQGITRDNAETHVSALVAQGQLAPYMKEWAVDLCTANMPVFEEFLAKVGPAFKSMVSPLVWERSQIKTSSSQLSDVERSVCANMGISEEDFIKVRAPR